MFLLPPGVPFTPFSTFQILHILEVQSIISFNKYLISWQFPDAVLGEIQQRGRDFHFSYDKRSQYWTCPPIINRHKSCINYIKWSPVPRFLGERIPRNSAHIHRGFLPEDTFKFLCGEIQPKQWVKSRERWQRSRISVFQCGWDVSDSTRKEAFSEKDLQKFAKKNFPWVFVQLLSSSCVE